MSNDGLFQEVVSSCCGVIRREVKITLKTSKEVRGATVTGEPIDCNLSGTKLVQHTDQAWVTCNESNYCLLKATRITTGRKQH